jgi:hypothetical protein
MDDLIHKQARKAASHIARSTGATVMISGDVDLRPMMSFLKTSYGFVPTEIDGAAHVFFSPVGEACSAKAARKHGALIAAQLGRAAVYMPETITKPGLEKLLDVDVAFVVPGRHLHLPGRVTEIGTRFEHVVDAPMTPSSPGALGPTAQAMLIRHLLRRDEGHVPSMMLAAALGVTSMTSLAAANELVAADLARRARSGHVGSLDYVSSGRDLFERALPLLQSPVLLTQRYSGEGVVKRYMQGGETALARMTNLAEPSVPVFATSRRNRLGVAQRFDLQPCHRGDADMTFEVWRYAPEATGWPRDLVDPLSLHLQFKNHPDERVASAAKELLETAFVT